ncbi:hypothetical protein [Catenovulum maritimum]|uniref:Uncharacterized protein n=1 Tax=Catenovulum maritimum TaxID=1513271 RepID=A0A0J8JKM4_9ALTE|nr:hypothetical protein [Catenovulum maritimum]KMT65011.1 hypothetical protein XM47_11050 [Catenovulum maritimum]
MRLALSSFILLFLTACATTTPPKISYSGEYIWDGQQQTLKLTTNGSLTGGHTGWTVPTQIKNLIIAKDVRVQGRFNVFHSMEIKGEDKYTSVIYGTPITRYNKKNNGCGLCKSAVLAKGNITVKITNLTSLDPYAFHFTGRDKAKLIIDSVRAIDARGGHQNNSDGVSAADGTIVRNSYFETADDIIKVYADISVENTVIKMIGNTLPIQFGWGSYGNNATATFKNVLIIGNQGRTNTGNAIIDARKGRYTKNLYFNNVSILNPTASLMNLWNEGQQAPAGVANITIQDSTIQVKSLANRKNMLANIEICGQTVDINSRQNTWNCGSASLTPDSISSD